PRRRASNESRPWHFPTSCSLLSECSRSSAARRFALWSLKRARSTSRARGGELMAEKRQRGLGQPYLRGTTWWIRYSYRGKQQRESSHSTRESDAIALLKKRLGEIGRGRLIGPNAERVIVSELTERLLRDYTINARRSHASAASIVKKHLAPFFGDF